MVNERIHLNTFGIPFALCGIASVWSQAEAAFPISAVVSISLWVIAFVVFIAFLVAHSSAGTRTRQKLISQLRHPEQAPMASLVPMIVMLLGQSLSHCIPGGGRRVHLLFWAGSCNPFCIMACWLLAQGWL